MHLEKHLLLDHYFLNLLGFKEFDELREALKDQQEGFDKDGRSYFLGVLAGRGALSIPGPTLARYDSAIREYVLKLRRNRRQPDFNLKYFQYLAVLFTEIFLDELFNNRKRFLSELNEFVKTFNSQNDLEIEQYSSDELRKLAYWIATGGGKTLIMHINYWQFLAYSKREYDNLLLITPNAGLSRQHYDEMRKSGVPCKLYDGNPDNLKTNTDEVLIVDMYKISGEKTGEGVTVDVTYFDGKNLVFIDEGHKGQRSEEQVWKRLREQIGKDGFIFEYSATFGQVIGKDEALLAEYSKSIIFDYSYKYFYTDGYGKDFYVYNLREDMYTQKHTDVILTAGLLAYYEQLLIFEENQTQALSEGFERPLWVFIGSKVSGNKLESDVIRIIGYLEQILNDPGFLQKTAEKILDGKSGLVDDQSRDIFEDRFLYIRKRKFSLRDLYIKVFGGQGSLEVLEIKNAEGELGLRLGEKYFGVVNIGDVDAVKKLLKEKGTEVKADILTPSLFSEINDRTSRVNLLVGARKFIEGWDSWRVSSMGLINMGKGEGPQIIQIFGRGVRLKGKDFSLKRSNQVDYASRSMETLFIFGLNADYINAFLESIKTEEVEFDEEEISIRFNQPSKWVARIHTIGTREDFNFADNLVELKVDDKLISELEVDLRPKIVLAHGMETSHADLDSSSLLSLDQSQLNLLDWNLMHCNLLDYKVAQGYYNLLISKASLKEIITSGRYRILTSPEQRDLSSFSEVSRLESIVMSYLKSYIDRFYRRSEKREAMNNLTVKKLNRQNDNLNFEKFVLKFPRGSVVVGEIQKLLKALKKVYSLDDPIIPSVHFDRHLYTPLLVYLKGREEIKSYPVKLNKGETKFIKDLRDYLVKNPNELGKNEVFVLRNLSKRGIGFFQSSGFYPDFILWVKSRKKERIVFLDPKGIRNLGSFRDEKIEFCNSTITEIEEALKSKTKLKLELDSFILSVTPPEDVVWAEGASKAEFEQHKIIFMTDQDWVGNLLAKVVV